MTPEESIKRIGKLQRTLFKLIGNLESIKLLLYQEVKK